MTSGDAAGGTAADPGVPMRGRAWVCKDYVDAYQILPPKYWAGGESVGKLNADELGPHAMEGVDSAFAARAGMGEFRFIVTGKMFGGGGKSIEHPIVAIKGAGVKGVLSESASRYFYRNMINNGVPILICEGITSQVNTGDELEVDLSKGLIKNLSSGKELTANPLPKIALDIIGAGGYIQYTRRRLESMPSPGARSEV